MKIILTIAAIAGLCSAASAQTASFPEREHSSLSAESKFGGRSAISCGRAESASAAASLFTASCNCIGQSSHWVAQVNYTARDLQNISSLINILDASHNFQSRKLKTLVLRAKASAEEGDMVQYLKTSRKAKRYFWMLPASERMAINAI